MDFSFLRLKNIDAAETISAACVAWFTIFKQHRLRSGRRSESGNRATAIRARRTEKSLETKVGASAHADTQIVRFSDLQIFWIQIRRVDAHAPLSDRTTHAGSH
jgi:hypothetical protein